MSTEPREKVVDIEWGAGGYHDGAMVYPFTTGSMHYMRWDDRSTGVTFDLEINLKDDSGDSIRIPVKSREHAESIIRTIEGSIKLDETELIKLLSAALQHAWDDFIGDTGCVPDAISIHGPSTTRISADFHKGNFTIVVARYLLEHVDVLGVGSEVK